MTDGELPPHVKHFFNAYARGFTQSCTAQARTASLAAALGKGGFLVKDFLVRLSPPCLFPPPQPPPIPPPPASTVSRAGSSEQRAQGRRPYNICAK